MPIDIYEPDRRFETIGEYDRSRVEITRLELELLRAVERGYRSAHQSRIALPTARGMLPAGELLSELESARMKYGEAPLEPEWAGYAMKTGPKHGAQIFELETPRDHTIAYALLAVPALLMGFALCALLTRAGVL